MGFADGKVVEVESSTRPIDFLPLQICRSYVLLFREELGSKYADTMVVGRTQSGKTQVEGLIRLFGFSKPVPPLISGTI